jgi:hypothetical protein
MARMSAPPKNNIYTLMLIVTTIVCVIGLVMNHTKLSESNSIKAAVPREVDKDAVKEMWSSSEVDETDNTGDGDLDKLLGIEEE